MEEIIIKLYKQGVKNDIITLKEVKLILEKYDKHLSYNLQDVINNLQDVLDGSDEDA